jgi:hypothetical protein
MYPYPYDYSFGNLQMLSTSTEWAPMMSEEVLEMPYTTIETSELPAKSGLVRLAMVTSLFLISFGSLTFGTVKVAEGAGNLHQPLVPMQISSQQHLQ